VGVDRCVRRPGGSGGITLTESVDAARVVPDIPSYAVDDGFWYSIPEPLKDRVEIGSMVRVPLGGRRVKGFVVELGRSDSAKLRDVAQVSGRSPVLTPGLLESLRWVAQHYVAPMGPILDRASPPNVPPAPPRPSSPAATERVQHGLSDVVDAVVTGRRHRPVVLLEQTPAGLVELARDCTAGGASLMIVAPTALEVAAIAGALEAAGVGASSVVPEMADKDVTSVWRHVRHGPVVVVGTPRIVTWPVHTPAVVVAIEESRRAMKERQSPTLAVRDILLVRSRRENLAAVFLGPTPSAELMGTGPDVRRLNAGRLWPLVEVVDRKDDPPGGGLLGETAKQAIRAIAPTGSVFVYAHSHGYSAASRCVSCRTLRVCGTCGSRPDPRPTCARCGAVIGPCASCGKDRFEPLGAGTGRLIEEIGRIVDKRLVGPMEARRAIRVGTERDLPRVAACDLAVWVDADGVVRGTNYRAAEEALRIGARLAGIVTERGRLLLQTNDPDHHAIVALRRADPVGFHETEIEQRRAFGYPPAGELMVIEVRNLDDAELANSELVAIGSRATILGPAESARGVRWLVQGPDLDPFKLALRPVVDRWRNAGAAVRIDADPIDL
jgi:primosomal protein N' (replication factor Y)